MSQAAVSGHPALTNSLPDQIHFGLKLDSNPTQYQYQARAFERATKKLQTFIK